MMFKTTRAIFDHIVYTSLGNGRWRAEFRGAVEVAVEGPSLERCRWAALDALDERMSTWIVSKTEAVTAEDSIS